jgi:hypothetical protein
VILSKKMELPKPTKPSTRGVNQTSWVELLLIL